MFILVLFGYRQSRIFTIDCLSASLIDAILDHSVKDMLKLVSEKEAQHQEELTLIEKTHLAKIEKRLEEIKTKQKEKEEHEPGHPESQESVRQKEEKQKKEKGKGKNQAGQEDLDPLEAQRQELVKEQETLSSDLEKYKEKAEKCEEQRKRLQSLGEVVVELVDSAGERKYVKTKAEQIANSYLADKGTYTLALVRQSSRNIPALFQRRVKKTKWKPWVWTGMPCAPWRKTWPPRNRRLCCWPVRRTRRRARRPSDSIFVS